MCGIVSLNAKVLLLTIFYSEMECQLGLCVSVRMVYVVRLCMHKMYVYVKKLSTFIWPHPLLDVLFSLSFFRLSVSLKAHRHTHTLTRSFASTRIGEYDGGCNLCVCPFGVDL